MHRSAQLINLATISPTVLVALLRAFAGKRKIPLYLKCQRQKQLQIRNEILQGIDVVQYIRGENNKLWMTLVSSDWFSYFLQYLNLKDIANLDSAFCNVEERMH